MRIRKTLAPLAAAAVLLSGTAAMAGTVTLYAAGSLKTALGAVAEDFADATGTEVATAFGPSGLMRQRIESGETAHVFAPANIRHPRTLEAAGRGGPVALFARNRLCALARPEVAVGSGTLLETILSEDIRLGTSTPKADPSGDHAWDLFAKAEAVRPGAAEAPRARALQLTGGLDSAPAPVGRNTYAW